MIMGRLVSKKKYELYEYVVAVLITVGMVGFFYGSEDMPTSGNKTATTTFSGIILLVLVIEMMKSQLKSININSFNERLFEDF
jgi:adenosine 3'-phospho 5'-phosphosulfate transporter B2